MSEWVERAEDLEVFRRAYRLSLEVHRASLELRGSSNSRWPIRCGGPRNRSARTSPRVSVVNGCRGPSLVAS
jgi:hypothetical protein